MADIRFDLKGWKAIVVLLGIVAVLIIRLLSFSDMTGDEDLMQKVKLHVIEEYFTDDVARLKAAVESGDAKKIAEVSKIITGDRMKIESVQASYPLFKFTSTKDVVVKVRYSLNDGAGPGKSFTSYYLFRYGMIGNNWSYQYKTSFFSYYLNFL